MEQINPSKKSKRCFDTIVSALCYLLISPVIVMIALVVARRQEFSVFFKQTRTGYLGRPFKLYKLRTMLDLYDSNGKMFPDEDRLTKFGQWLRSTSLDELPELLNVLKGDMSIVGPRPLLMRYLERYTPEQARRHDVKPGLTGWAQINGRNAISWDEKFKLDVWYVDNQSMRLDFKILALTIRKVVTRDGISHGGEATMHEFLGSDRK